MSAAVDFLEHYGVKGMKWGVHNGETGANGSRRERKAANKESKLAYKAWKKEVGGEKVANEVFQDAAKSFGKAVKVINNLPEFKGKDLTQDRKLARTYDKVTAEVFNQHLAAASIDRTITNTGRAMIYQFDRNVGMMRAQESQLVYHAEDEGYPDFIADMDENGQIVSLRRADEDPFVKQMDEAADFLSHYGVKGMKWGKRQKRPDEAERKARFGPKKKSGVVKEGPSEEAQRAGEIKGRARAQKSTQMLSNKELQDTIKRMQLEQQFSQLSGNIDKTGGQKARLFVSNMLQTSGKQSSQQIANEQAKNQLQKAFGFAVKKGAGA